MIRRAVKNIPLREAPSADVPVFIRELRRVGYTLNQLAAFANSRNLIDAPQLRKALESNRAVEKMVVEAYTWGGN